MFVNSPNVFIEDNFKIKQMRGIIIADIDEAQLNEKQIKNWPIWKKEISCFDWKYDSDEECYIIDGEVRIETKEGEIFIKKGDFVTFKKGLKCMWDIKAPIKKYYNFK